MSFFLAMIASESNVAFIEYDFEVSDACSIKKLRYLHHVYRIHECDPGVTKPQNPKTPKFPKPLFAKITCTKFTGVTLV